MGCTEFFSEIIVKHTGTYNKGVLTGQMTNGRPFCLMKHFVNPEACTQAGLAVLQ